MEAIFNLKLFESKEIALVVSIIYGILIFATVLVFSLSRMYPDKDLSELKARTKSWWFITTLFIGTTIVDTNISYIAIAFLSFVAFRELYSLLEFRQSDRSAIFLALISIPVQYYLAYIGWYGAFIIFIPVVMFLVLPMRLVFKGDTNGIVKSMSLLQWSLMLTVFGLSHLAYLISLPTIKTFP